MDDELLRETKALAVRSGRTVTKVIEDALRETLVRRDVSPSDEGEVVSFPTFRGDGLMPGVDLDDSAALLDLMEGDDPR